MQRRDLLKAFGAATALAFIPRDAMAIWARVASGVRPAGGLTDAQLSLVGAIADTILPRSDSPSATDVQVPSFVDVVVSENYSDAERAAFLAGLTTLSTWSPPAPTSADTTVQAGRSTRSFVDLPGEERGALIEALEHAPSRREEPMRTYWRLKGLVIHGYFTSERVSKEVLHVEVMPGRFEGSAPLAAPAPAHRSGDHEAARS
ncbi:MAG TPA: gluconate 2-dehydrogenase subunit 3 family protein [Gemmatimonadaceae bacterium]|nr:gluconate 2-dehydrogenase subunit 3 family protein [Gemmatimonadaceae bacterium]